MITGAVIVVAAGVLAAGAGVFLWGLGCLYKSVYCR